MAWVNRRLRVPPQDHLLLLIICKNIPIKTIPATWGLVGGDSRSRYVCLETNGTARFSLLTDEFDGSPPIRIRALVTYHYLVQFCPVGVGFRDFEWCRGVER